MGATEGSDRPTTDWRRLFRLAAAVAAAVLAVIVGPDLSRSAWSHVKIRLPAPLGAFFEDSAWLWAGLAAAAPLQWAFLRRRSEGRDEGPVDRFARRLLAVALPWTLAGLIGLMLLTWLPHRLLWPWWADVEHFALSALSWEAGLVPYRDLYDFNFPGPMYLHWGLGKVFGWGRTMPFYALDTLIFVGFAATVVWWSRRRLGGPIPGLLSILALTHYQCTLPYWLSAQRDWHVPLMACAGLMILEARPGRGSRLAAAALAAAAFSCRPHVIVFGPAYLAALDENARPIGGPAGRTVRAVLEWAAVAALGGVLAFAPLLATGVLDDFHLNFREALDGGYEETGSRPFGADIVRQLTPWRTVGVGIGVLAMAFFAAPALRRLSRTWLLALVFVLLYLPLSPVAHAYLDHPLKVVWCVSSISTICACALAIAPWSSG
ncbi:MAG: hypothetical protein K2X91_06035, partial [Thermoleophilia bacterium]|nr:hypothetical protein [Thermoleophilia bacterium]